jgi:hypothetical protein
MDGQEIIKLVYKLYLALPLILTILFIGIGIYKFFQKEDECEEYIINGAVGILALIVGSITLNILMPLAMFEPEFPIFNTIGSVIYKIIVTLLLLIVITKDDMRIKDRLYFLGTVPFMFLAIYLIQMLPVPNI